MSNREYNIAVLLATHKRTDALTKSTFSIVDNADDISKIQIIFGIDNNDDIGKNHFLDVIKPRLDELGVAYKALQFEPLGYFGLNQYYNTLAKSANADWLFVWCDDAIMETTGWDTEICKNTGQFKLLKVHTHNEHPYSIFPIAPIEWFEQLGYLSQHQLIDSELSQVAYYLDIMKIIDVSVTHDRSDLTGNNNDENAQKKKYLEGNPTNPKDFHYQSFNVQRVNDAERLSHYLISRGEKSKWWEGVKAGTQDPWENLKKNDINGQTKQYKLGKR